jgi:hypothetical protein
MADESAAAWVGVLNGDASSKSKLAALAKLAERALHDPDEVLDVLHTGLGEAFEVLLTDKVEAHSKFGTALGRMHETVLLTLIRATKYHLRTSELLDFVRGDLTLAMEVLSQLFSCTAYEEEALACALELLGGFARPDTYAELDSGARGSFSLEGTVEAFSRRLESFSIELLKSKLLLTVVPALSRRLTYDDQKSLERRGSASLSTGQQGCARAFMRLVCDLTTLNFEEADACRSDLAAASSAGSTLLLPLLLRLADDPPPPAPPPQQLVLALRTAVLLCFRAPAHVTTAIRVSGVLAALLPFCVAPGHPTRLGELYVALAINVDALRPLCDASLDNDERRRADALLADMQAAFDALDVHEAHELLHAIESGAGSTSMARLPVARDAPTARDLGELLQQLLASAQPDEALALRDQLSDLEAKASHLEIVQEELRSLAETELPSMSAAFEQMAVLEAELRDGEVAAQQIADQLGVDLNSAIDDDGRAGEPDVHHNTTAPSSAVAAAATATTTMDASGNNEATAPTEAMRLSERFRLLGELPALNMSEGPRGRTLAAAKAEASAAAAASGVSKPRKLRKPPRRGGGATASANDGSDPVLEENVPSEFLCSINQHILRKPLRSPAGHVFEAATLELWMREHGPVCPVSGAPLAFEDLQPDIELRRRIQEYLIKQALASQEARDAEDDPYAFG